MPKNELVALSLLYGDPKHAYAINEIMKQVGFEEWSSVSKASIYSCLKKLEKNGQVTVSTERNSNMPERRIYAITEAGQEQLQLELREALLAHENNYERLFLALVFGIGLPGTEILALLEQRKEQIAQVIIKEKEHLIMHEQFGVIHPQILVGCGIKQLGIVIEMIDSIIELLKDDPDYYYKSYMKCKQIYEQRETK